MREKIFATVSGTTVQGFPFKDHVEFTLLLPKESDVYYGTGCYMEVIVLSLDKEPHKHLIDVRYAGTTDIDILADRWIGRHYGKNVKEVTKIFPE